ncbi:MAG: hypothetical protein WBF53_03160 [Litorimonas sp.]
MAKTIITKKVRNELRRMREASGVSGMRLLRSREGVPEGLDSGHITGWLSGQIRYAEKAHLEYVLSIWPKVDPLIKITDQMVRQINAEFQRTGVQVKSVAKQLSAIDPKFGENGITRMRKGKRTTIYQNTWSSLLEILAQYPEQKSWKSKSRSDKLSKPKMKTKVLPGTGFNPKQDSQSRYSSQFADDYIELLESHRVELVKHRNRTGVAATELLRRFAATKPDKLSANTISTWINCRTKKASRSRLSWVLQKWRSLPDKPS